MKKYSLSRILVFSVPVLARGSYFSHSWIYVTSTMHHMKKKFQIMINRPAKGERAFAFYVGEQREKWFKTPDLIKPTNVSKESGKSMLS